MRRLIPLILVLSLFGVNCGESTSTQLVVLMDTDYAVPAEVDRFRARVAKIVETEGGPEEVETWTEVFSISNDEDGESSTYTLPATFSVVPDGTDLEREIVIELAAIGAGGNEVLVTRRVRTGFVAGQARLLNLLIHRACASLSCSQGENCGCPGASACATPSCVDESLPPEELELIDDPAQLPPDYEFPSDPDAGVPDGGDGCEPPRTICDQECVDVSSDARYCGDCTTVCPSGFVCSSGTCSDPGDCRTNDLGCTGFTYCDESTGDCERGCSIDEQCTGNNEACNVETHECVCSPGFERCAFDCVDVESDPRYCGGCLNSCPAGEVCEQGICIDPGDCRINGVGCSGFTYCDETTGNCLRGCDRDAQCTGRNQACDVALHDCVCAEGFHECAGVCVSDLDPNSCGDSCTPCPAPSGGTPVCTAGVCDFVCNDDLEACDGECVDTQSNQLYCGDCDTSCAQGQICEAGGCFDPGDCRLDGVDCGESAYCEQSTGMCLPGCDSNAQCAGANEVCDQIINECVCAVDYHLCANECVSDFDVDTCGDSCTPCIPPPSATPTCAEGVCDFECDANFERCDNGCCQEVAATGNVGEYTSIALDAAGAPNIAYYARNGKNLRYSRLTAVGDWQSLTADDSGDAGRHASLAIDASSQIHIAYYEGDSKDLKYAVRQAGAVDWVHESVAVSGDVGKYASLAVEDSGFPHIAYYDESNKDLRYARPGLLTPWRLETVDSKGDVGTYASLALDQSGAPHIAYYDESNKDLRYATRGIGGAWSTETVDAEGDVGTHASLAFDPSGFPHIAYYDESNKSLIVATKAAGGQWTTRTIDGGEVGRYASLAFDEAGAAHVSYLDESGFDLKHASRKASAQAWTVQTVDSAGDVGEFTSIAVDTRGYAHISYRDKTNTSLKYAIAAVPQ